MDVRVVGWDEVDSSHVAQDKDQWWAAVTMVVDICITYKTGSTRIT